MREFLPEFIASRLKQPVAILGAGMSGLAAADLVAGLGGTSRLFDEKGGVGTEKYFPENQASLFGLVIFSPGFAIDHPWLEAARQAGCLCLGEVDFASFFWRGEIIAITGTNGKTTLTEFMTHALKHLGREAHAVGNVGYPFTRFVAQKPDPQSVVVCEVSSYQAETLQHMRVAATLWTNIDEDHLERHPGMRVYFEAKAKLMERTSAGGFFAGTSVVAFAREEGIALPVGAAVITEGLPFDPRLDGTIFAYYPQRENFILAEAFWRSRKWPVEKLLEAARTFRLGRHRLARVGEVKGVGFWNDSKATNFHAVKGALQNFSQPVLWIGGGKPKGGDIEGFGRRIAPKIRSAFLIGQTRDILAGSLESCGVPCVRCDSLDEAIRRAFSQAKAGDEVLLSPGFASFDMFRNYEDRGEQFEKVVNDLKNSHF